MFCQGRGFRGRLQIISDCRRSQTHWKTKPGERNNSSRPEDCYHAKHYLNCFALTLMIVFVSLSLVNHLNHIIATILFSISSMIIFEFAPTNSSSLHLSTQEMKAMRGKVRVRLAVLSGIMILFLFFDLHKAYCIVLAITVVAILLLPSAIAVYFNKQGEKMLWITRTKVKRFWTNWYAKRFEPI